jgi:hypothetical protein
MSRVDILANRHREKSKNPEGGRAIGFISLGWLVSVQLPASKLWVNATFSPYRGLPARLITSRAVLEKIACLLGRSTGLSFRWKAIVGRTRRTELHPVDGKSSHIT